MVGKEIKKILVFGIPRSGTTVLQRQLAELFKLDNLVEPELDESLKSPYHWVSNQNNCVIKYLSTTMVYRPFFKFKRLIDQGKFDSIVLTERNNLTYGCISCFYAQKVSDRFHYFTDKSYPTPSKFECDMIYVDDWIIAYKKYLESKKFLDKTNTPYTVIKYEDYTSDKEQQVENVRFRISSLIIDTYDPHLPYSSLCTNYKEVDARIKEAITND